MSGEKTWDGIAYLVSMPCRYEVYIHTHHNRSSTIQLNSTSIPSQKCTTGYKGKKKVSSFNETVISLEWVQDRNNRISRLTYSVLHSYSQGCPLKWNNTWFMPPRRRWRGERKQMRNMQRLQGKCVPRRTTSSTFRVLHSKSAYCQARPTDWAFWGCKKRVLNASRRHAFSALRFYTFIVGFSTSL